MWFLFPSVGWLVDISNSWNYEEIDPKYFGKSQHSSLYLSPSTSLSIYPIESIGYTAEFYCGIRKPTITRSTRFFFTNPYNKTTKEKKMAHTHTHKMCRRDVVSRFKREKSGHPSAHILSIIRGNREKTYREMDYQCQKIHTTIHAFHIRNCLDVRWWVTKIVTKMCQSYLFLLAPLFLVFQFFVCWIRGKRRKDF